MSQAPHDEKANGYSMKTGDGGFGRFGKWILGIYAEPTTNPVDNPLAENKPSWLGTAFLLSDQYALTAWHTLEDYLKNLAGIEEDHPQHHPVDIDKMTVTLLQINLNGADEYAYDPDGNIYFNPIHVKKFYRIPDTDLGILEFDSIPLETTLKLSLKMPPIGAEVTCVGYTGMNMIYPLVPIENRKELIATTFMSVMSKCTVLKVHPYRHSAYHPFPSFELQGEILGGMSGGPVFYEGRIIGVCTASLKANFEEDPKAHPWSIVSTLHPLKKFRMRIPHKSSTDERKKRKEISFLGLIKRYGIDIEM